MASKRIDELTTRAVVNTDLLPPTPTGGPSGSATVAAVVAAGLSQPNSASAGAGASITIKAADGVTSGAGGSIILQPGAQATTGGDGLIVVRQPGGSAGTNEAQFSHDGTRLLINNRSGPIRIAAYPSAGNGSNLFEIRSRLNDRNSLVVTDNGATYVGYLKTGYDIGSGFVTVCGIEDATPTNWRNAFNVQFLWTSSTFNALPDAGIIRGSANVLKITNGSTGGGSFAYTSATSSAITASQNDYVLAGSAFQRLNCTSASNITGIAPPTSGAHVDGRMIRIVNVGTATLTLQHNSTSSAAANRMFCASGADYALATNAWAELVYDSTDNGSGAAGWRVYQ